MYIYKVGICYHIRKSVFQFKSLGLLFEAVGTATGSVLPLLVCLVCKLYFSQQGYIIKIVHLMINDNDILLR